MVFFLPVNVNGKCQVFAGLEEVQLFFQQQGVGAKINIFLAGHQTFHDLFNLGVHQRFAAGDGHHRRAAFVHCIEAFFRRELLLQHVSRILNFSAARASQVALVEWLQHQNERILLPSLNLLFEDVTRYRPRLGNWYRHSVP